MSKDIIREMVQDAKGRGPLARVAACALAAHYRAQLGYAPVKP